MFKEVIKEWFLFPIADEVSEVEQPLINQVKAIAKRFCYAK
jgi:hypothetical protein